MRGKKKASFFLPFFLLHLSLRLANWSFNFIKMTQSDCMRAELHSVNVLLSVSNVPRRLDRQSAHLSARTDTAAIQKWIWGNNCAVYLWISHLSWSHLAAASCSSVGRQHVLKVVCLFWEVLLIFVPLLYQRVSRCYNKAVLQSSWKADFWEIWTVQVRFYELSGVVTHRFYGV